MTVQISSLINFEEGLVDRRIFGDPEIYDLERERIFARSWLYLGHESEIPKPNDFCSAYMAEEPVILCRDSDGQIRAFLNVCRHRGNRVCRADRGNSKSFFCSYHGWTYSNEGELVGLPMAENYPNFDRKRWGLIPTSQLQSYKGLIFATFDPEAPTLREYLGDMAWYLDIFLDRRQGGTEVGRPHKWVVNANWKTAAEGFAGDSYHVPITHASARQVGLDTTNDSMRQRRVGTQIMCGNGHALQAWRSPPEQSHPWFAQPAEMENYIKEHAGEIENRLGPLRARRIAPSAGTVFPNFSFHCLSCSIRLWLPRGPQKMEIWSWSLVDKAASPEMKRVMARYSEFRFSPTGMFEQDDVENWIQMTEAASSTVAKRFPVNYQMSMGQEPQEDELPGRLTSKWSDANQLHFYRQWLKLMDAEGRSGVNDGGSPHGYRPSL
jgi:3-phenylpropionate/trans-cinnamate dioxygenase subunit alpha